MATVLCVGVDEQLVLTRVYILENAGHRVVPAKNEPEVLAACAENKFQVAVIGQMISPAGKLRIHQLIRQHCPGAKILELYTVTRERVLTGADAWLLVPTQVPSDLADHVQALAAS